MRRGSLRIGARGLDAKNGGEIFAAITYAERCRKVQIWLLSGPARSGGFSDEAICAGLDGAANLKIAASSGGRANRPDQKLSTVAPKKAKPPQAHHSQPSYAAYLRHQRCLPPPPTLLTPATSVADFSHKGHKGTQSFSCLSWLATNQKLPTNDCGLLVSPTKPMGHLQNSYRRKNNPYRGRFQPWPSAKSMYRCQSILVMS